MTYTELEAVYPHTAILVKSSWGNKNMDTEVQLTILQADRLERLLAVLTRPASLSNYDAEQDVVDILGICGDDEIDDILMQLPDDDWEFVIEMLNVIYDSQE